MKIVMGSDHAGVVLKDHLAEHLREAGHEVVDVGTHGTSSVDYPTYGETAARMVAAGDADRAVLVCGTGQGIGMAANKVPGIRCAIVSEPFSAKLSREHNDANALAIGARVVGEGVAEDIVDTWIATEFLGGRHGRRVSMLDDIDAGRHAN
ncbi:MAG: ribose 5-phosphate isomerase B [Actinomyces sp.]|nr:ribose 5-phosphate isomerase B [Actinomyces sp.]MDN6428679.1 ribose 5-phosphate isomerase B [Propionibacterium sp.]MDN6565443.1 ribose 5-phosphate isomerase B [Actinomyces sp.]MDN6795071.1 ribose 5-phosphate isomerase B [Propionibacterium sp.]